MNESICAVRSLTFFGPCLTINCSKFQPYVSAETQRTEKKLILVKILRILLWRQTGWNDAWSEEDLICGENVSEVCQPRDCKMYLTVVKVGEVLVGILFALVKATFWGLFSVVWVAMFYVLIVNVHSVLYFYAQTWWDSDLHLKTKHWESLGSYSKPFICSMRWITQTSLIVMTIKVNWLRLESV